jgi:diguanylate cyclase (GGDEF)-like protein
MSNSDVFWLADPNIRDFFMRFPLPLAVLDKDGNIRLLNKRFTATFDSACLKSDKLRQMLLSTDNLIQAITLLQRNDCLAEVYARTINIDDDVILILDESAESAYTDELSELRERITDLEKLISNDRLTGVWNRAHFDKILKMELSRSVRYRQPVTLIFLDIDHFQQVNDSHGCAAGDEVLRELVKVISKNIRASDMLFRWEGAQFAILAPSTSRHSAASLAETLRSKIEQHEITTAGHITISLGVAEYVSGEGAETWFQRADEALHNAKSGGRNRVVVDQHGSDLSDQDNTLLRLERYDSDAGIDPQQRKLFDLANMLIDAAITRKANSREFNEALKTLLAHVEQHFAEK